MDPATYIVLLILRSLDTTLITSSTVVLASLTDRLKPLLAKREIKVQYGILFLNRTMTLTVRDWLGASSCCSSSGQPFKRD